MHQNANHFVKRVDVHHSHINYFSGTRNTGAVALAFMEQITPMTKKSEARQILNNFFSFILFFHFIPIGNTILKRFYSCNFLAERHSLGVTGAFI